MSNEKEGAADATLASSLYATHVATRGAQQPAAPRQDPRAAASPLHSHINSHRAELDSIDERISSLDRTIELEQEKLRESKSNLNESYQARRDLMHLRMAMVNFVQYLEAKQGGE